MPYRARDKKVSGKDNWDVLDKELAVWLKPIYDMTEDVIYVSDSCHSATVARGLLQGVRRAAPVGRPHPLLGKLPKIPKPETGLRIGASRDDESAVELQFPGGGNCEDGKMRSHCYGVFTWYWAQALRESQPGESWGDVFKRATARITTSAHTSQVPQMEGSTANRAVFAAQFAPLTTSVEVLDVLANGNVKLNAGLLAGMSVDSIFRKVSPERSDEATLRITEVEPFTSNARALKGNIKPGELATEVKHAFSIPNVRLFVGANDISSDSSRVEKLRQEMSKQLDGILSGFTLVPNPENADWWLMFVRPESDSASGQSAGSNRHMPDPKACKAPCSATELWVVSRQGLLLDEHMRFDLNRIDTEFPRLLDNLRKYARAQQIRRLAANGNPTPVRLDVSTHRRPTGDKRKCKEAVGTGNWVRLGPYKFDAVPKGQAPSFDDCLSFELVNTDPDATWFGYVVAVGPDFEVIPIIPGPDDNADAGRIPPLHRNNGDNLYRLNMAGQETVLLIVGNKPVNVLALRQIGLKGETSSELDNLLMKTPGQKGEIESRGDDRWGATSQDFWITKR